MSLISKLFKKKKVVQKTFNYTLKVEDKILDYKYTFEAKNDSTDDELMKICYKEFVNRHSVDMIDNIVDVSIV